MEKKRSYVTHVMGRYLQKNDLQSFIMKVGAY